MLLVQVSNHFVLVIDVLFYLVDVGRSLPVILFLNPVHRLGGSLRHWQNILDCIGNDEVFAWLQSLHWLLVDAWHRGPFVLAIIWEVLGDRELLVAHSAGFRFQKLFWIRFAIAFKLPECFGLAELGVSLEAAMELTGEVMPLNRLLFTMGLDVVWWQKVEPVGTIFGGYLDL